MTTVQAKQEVADPQRRSPGDHHARGEVEGHVSTGLATPQAFASRQRSPTRLLALQGVVGNRAIAARRGGLLDQVHPTIAARAARAFPASARHVTLQSGFHGMGAFQGAVDGDGLLGASQGARVALAPSLHRALQTAHPGRLAEHTLYHELAHTRQRAPRGRGVTGDPRMLRDEHNEAEADTLATLAMAGHTIESPTAAFTGGPPVVQASMADERRAAEGRRRFADASKAYELHMGGVLRRDPAAHAAADLFLDELQQITTAWATATGKQLDDVMVESFGWQGGDHYYGAFRMTAQNLRNVFQNAATRPLREKLKVVYNAVRNNNFAKWLKVAALQLEQSVLGAQPPTDVQNLDDGSVETADDTFFVNSGLRDKYLANNAQFQEAQQAVYYDNPAPAPAPALKTGKHNFSRALAWSRQVQGYNADRIGGMNRDRDALRMSPLKLRDVELTDAEIDQIGINQKLLDPDEHDAARLRAFRRAFRAENGNRPIPWEKGTGYYDVLVNSHTEQLASSVRARLLAGVSGSTDLMLHAAQYMNFSPANMNKLRLAMLGWMLETEDHSVFEILEAGVAYGLPFDRGAQPGEMYEIDANFAPKQAADFRMKFGPAIADAPDERAYPGVFLTPDHVDAIQRKDPNVGLAAYRRKYRELGLPDAVLQGFAEQDMADLEQLDAAVLAAALRRGEQHQAHNFQQRRRIRDSAAYHDLAHRFPLHAELMLDHLLEIHHGVHALGDDERRRLGAAEHMPAPGRTLLQRRQLLAAAGVADAIAGGLQPVDVDAAVELRALVRGAKLRQAANRGAAAVRANAAELRALRQLRAYRSLEGRVGQVVHVLFGAFLAELDPGLRAEGLGLAVQDPDQHALVELGVPETIAIGLDPAGVALARRVIRRVNTVVARVTANRTAKLHAIEAVAADALYTPLVAAIGEHNLRIVVHGAALKAGFDYQFTTNTGKRAALAGFTYATLGEVLQASAVRLDDHGRAAVRAQLMARNFAGPLRNTGNTEMQQTRQRMQDNLDDLVGGARYTAEHKAAYRGLDEVEVFGINQYTQHYGMGVWQGMLAARNADAAFTGVGEKTLQEQAWVMKAAVSGLNRLPVHAGTVYNGQVLPPMLPGPPGTAYNLAYAEQWVRGNYPLGRIVRQDTFFSTARSVGASFLSKATHNLAWVIDGIRTGRDIQPISDKPGEEEVLFPPGARFMVDRIDLSKLNLLAGADDLAGKLIVHMVEV